MNKLCISDDIRGKGTVAGAEFNEIAPSKEILNLHTSHTLNTAKRPNLALNWSSSCSWDSDHSLVGRWCAWWSSTCLRQLRNFQRGKVDSQAFVARLAHSIARLSRRSRNEGVARDGQGSGRRGGEGRNKIPPCRTEEFLTREITKVGGSGAGREPLKLGEKKSEKGVMLFPQNLLSPAYLSSSSVQSIVFRGCNRSGSHQ